MPGRGQRWWLIAPVFAVAIALLASVGATVVSASADTTGTNGAATTDSVPIDTDVPTPPSPSADASAELPAATAATTDVPTDDRERSVSSWWWVLGTLVGIAAVGGIVFSARRRTDDEKWAREVSTMCDTGRALAASVAAHLAEAPTWDPPERVGHQRDRFTSSLVDAIGAAPNAELAALTVAVSTRNDALGRAVDEVAIGEPIDVARQSLSPALNDLAAALTPLEHEAAAVVYGASLPSSRTTG